MSACSDKSSVPVDRCLECGAALFVSPIPYFPIDGGERSLCAECAVRRGGRFDAVQQAWIPLPTLADLPR